MDYESRFRQYLDALHEEGRYRVFADLKRRCGAYPAADHFAEGGTRGVTVWCSNDYLGMSQHPSVRAAMHEAIEEALLQRAGITVIHDPEIGGAIDGLAAELRFR